MNPEMLIREKPGFHMQEGNKPLCQSLGDLTLQWMIDNITKSFVTLETGYGLTTVLLLLLGQKHISIAPDANGYDRILKYCHEHDIRSGHLQYHVGFSEDVLPGMKFESPLDFILIDGGHGFPTPLIDWTYTHMHLEVGGYLMIDDVQLATGMIMRDFLLASPEWACERFFHPKTVVFKKVAPTKRQNWTDQPYMKEMDIRIRALTNNYRDAEAMRKAHLSPAV